jgi:cysteinyl-tRNA synthetase
MMRITNTLTGKKEAWAPRVAGEASLYVCGVTVYDDCHLGHARSAVVFDVIRNYLEYKGFSVRYVKNFTDIDDKIIRRAQQETRGWREITERYIAAYEADMERLSVRPPTVAPRATEHIPEMIRLIETLIEKGVAYAVEGDVYFEVARFAPYGKLSKRRPEEIGAQARVESDARKRAPLDFALWKSAKPGEPSWESPWGPGRPGWHIECSAMAMQYLGETFDLHGGGADLIFPHHENEIAQSEAATGVTFVPCWIHHGFVTVDQEKMSKSLGNFFTLREIFEKSSHLPQGVVSEVVRFYLLSTHYRSAIDFSDQSLKTAKNGLDPFYTLLQKLEERNLLRPAEDDDDPSLHGAFDAAMEDDFNTPRALAALQEVRSELNRLLGHGEDETLSRHAGVLMKLGGVLGLFRVPPSNWRHQPWEQGTSVPDDDAIQHLLSARDQARRERQWKRADEIREELSAAGVILEDRPDGTTRIKR